MNYTVFFSWQSDLPNKENRNAIKDSINKAIKSLNSQFTGASFSYDESTLNKSGSPDICGSIIEKIEKCDIFICDISIINKRSIFRKCPNPNVIFELGYASSHLGWDRIICLFNTNYGKIEQLPFDINHKRIIAYFPGEADYKKRLAGILQESMKLMLKNGILYNPLKDNMKGKIDYCILEITKQLTCLLYGTHSMSDALGKTNELLALNEKEIIDKLLDDHEVLGYFTNNDLQYVRTYLDSIFSALTSSVLYNSEWTLTVLEIIDWLRTYQWHISGRSKKPLATERNYYSNLFKVIYKDDKALLLKNLSSEKGVVLYSASLPRIKEEILISYQSIIDANADEYAKCFYNFFTIANKWLSMTGSEFILDPDYYVIGY